MPYNFAAESFRTKKLCSRRSSRKVQFSIRKTEKIVAFDAGVRGNVRCAYLRLIGKLVGDFLLVIIEFFSLGAFVLSQFTRVTDRQTDVRTLLRSRRPRLHTMQRGKNSENSIIIIIIIIIINAE